MLLEAGVGADAGEVRAVCSEAGGQDVVSITFVKEGMQRGGVGNEYSHAVAPSRSSSRGSATEDAGRHVGRGGG